MRLIHTKTFELREFVLDVSRIEFPRYAILSHTWGEQEVTFQDFQDLEQAQKKAGFNKILQCCDQAWKDGLEWAWVDTCCIDKSSSAELSEGKLSSYQTPPGQPEITQQSYKFHVQVVRGLVSLLCLYQRF